MKRVSRTIVFSLSAGENGIKYVRQTVPIGISMRHWPATIAPLRSSPNLEAHFGRGNVLEARRLERRVGKGQGGLDSNICREPNINLVSLLHVSRQAQVRSVS
jgi:hypothetical protein